MKIVWKNIDGTRHLFSGGDSVCGVIGLERNDYAAPCESCLLVLINLETQAFSEGIAH
jgi:hypothetical protein